MLGRGDVKRHAVGIGVFPLGARALAEVLDLAGLDTAAFLHFLGSLIDVVDEETEVMQAFAGA